MWVKYLNQYFLLRNALKLLHNDDLNSVNIHVWIKVKPRQDWHCLSSGPDRDSVERFVALPATTKSLTILWGAVRCKQCRERWWWIVVLSIYCAAYLSRGRRLKCSALSLILCSEIQSEIIIPSHLKYQHQTPGSPGKTMMEFNYFYCSQQDCLRMFVS